MKALESNEINDESEEYCPYRDENIKERTFYHPSDVCSNDNSIEVQIKLDETCHEFYCDVIVKQKGIDSSSDYSGGDSDWRLSPRTTKTNAKAIVAKLMDGGKELDNEFVMLPNDVDYLPTIYGPRTKMKLMVQV